MEVFYNQLKSGLPRYQTQPVYPKGEGDREGSGTETSTIVSGTRESGTKTKLYGVTNFSLLTFISSLTSTQTHGFYIVYYTEPHAQCLPSLRPPPSHSSVRAPEHNRGKLCSSNRCTIIFLHEKFNAGYLDLFHK